MILNLRMLHVADVNNTEVVHKNLTNELKK